MQSFFAKTVFIWALYFNALNASEGFSSIRADYGKELHLLSESDASELLQIRVVFHVVYGHESQNISDGQILSQLKVLNEDFQRRNADAVNTLEVFKAVAANSNIAFVLASVDETGNPTTGITRTQTSHGPFGNSDIHFSEQGGKNAWDTKRYLNIWVCNLVPGILGYGTPPGTPADLDGIVVHYESIGTKGTAKAPYDRGRTLTHEIGHWLGLSHLSGNSEGCEEDDGIDDTPKQDNEDQTCDLQHVSCGSLDMVQNFMNVSEDACLNLFTKSQASGMRSVLLNERAGVLDFEEYVTSISEDDPKNSFSINPAVEQKGCYYFQLPESYPGLRLTVINLAGNIVLQKQVENVGSLKNCIMNLSSFPNGIYIIHVAVENQIFRKKIIHSN